MKKILCLIDGLAMGGAERQMIGLVHNLRNNGYDAILVVYHHINAYSELVKRLCVPVVVLQTRNNRFSKIMAVQKYVRKEGGFDWIIAYKDGPACIGCILKMLGGKFKLIVSERNTTQILNKAIKKKFFLYRWANYIVPNSYSQERFIKENFPKLAYKTKTISNFTETQVFIPSKSSGNNPFCILTAARIAEQKNILNYLQAIKALKDEGYSGKIHFDWYGDISKGQDAYNNKSKVSHPYKTRLLVS